MTYRLTVPSGRGWGFHGLTDFYLNGNTHKWSLMNRSDFSAAQL
ncbi:hypothetical protein AB0I84_47025 [Streptomyces spectabilis]